MSTRIITVDIPSGHGITWPITKHRDPWAGVGVARVFPDSITEHQILHDLLEGIGKNTSVSGWQRNVESERDALVAFIAAHPIRHLVILDAQHLTSEALEIAAGTASVCGITLWLCEEEPEDDYVAARNMWPTTTATLDELLATLPHPVPVEAQERFPKTVLDGPVTFLAACRDRLEPDAYAVVLDRFAEARAAATSWANDTGDLSEDTVLVWLRSQLNVCRDTSEMLTVIRATQVALVDLDSQRWWLQVDLPRLLATTDRPPEATAADPATWRDLAAYRDPHRGAACALISVGAGTNDLCALRLEQIDPDGTGATLDDGTRHEVHPTARVYLRALRCHRNAEGAGPDDLAFGDHDGKKPHWRRFVRFAGDPTGDLGRALTSRGVTRTQPNSKRWASRYGVSVVKL